MRLTYPNQESPDLLLLLRMLCLGQGAWDMIDSQVFKEPRLVRTLHLMITCKRLNQSSKWPNGGVVL